MSERKTPAKSDAEGKAARPPAKAAGHGAKAAGHDDVEAFLAKLAEAPAAKSPGEAGRLIFILDATMSRQPTWDAACDLQADMFDAAAAMGGLEIKLIFFRGRECKASAWMTDGRALARMMSGVACQGGRTQIERALGAALREAEDRPVGAVVFVGDCIEENIDAVCARAGELGLRGARAFMFQEGFDPGAETAFREIARLTGGAYHRFDAGAAAQLKKLLAAVAVYASGGRAALEDYGAREGGDVLRLAAQIK